MSSHNIGKELHDAQVTIPDPGSAGVITVSQSNAICNIVTAGIETRTLARPTKAGVTVTLVFKTDAGDCTVTVTGGYNLAAATTVVFTDITQFAKFESHYSGSAYYWRLLSNSQIANAPVAQGAALTAALTTITTADSNASADYALQALTTSTPYGLATQAEAISFVYVVQNLQVRVAEIEARLEAAGIVAAN